MKNAWILPKENVDYLDDIFLDEKKLLRILPYKEYVKIPDNHLKLWAVKHAVYTFPTLELISWLKEIIAHRKAIEICAGHGAIGRALNIPSTDSYIQTTPQMQALYSLMGSPTTQPPSDVYPFEANEAVDALKPEVVVGAYVTQLFSETDGEEVGSSVCGVDEIAMLKKIQTYILIGNRESHGDKRLLKYPHKMYSFEWLVTRSMNPENNAIWVWNNE